MKRRDEPWYLIMNKILFRLYLSLSLSSPPNSIIIVSNISRVEVIKWLQIHFLPSPSLREKGKGIPSFLLLSLYPNPSDYAMHGIIQALLWLSHSLYIRYRMFQIVLKYVKKVKKYGLYYLSRYVCVIVYPKSFHKHSNSKLSTCLKMPRRGWGGCEISYPCDIAGKWIIVTVLVALVPQN